MPDTAAKEGQQVVYGIRPEHLHASEDGTEAVVAVIEPTGAEVQVFANLDDQNIIAVLRERLLLKPGEKVRLAPDMSLAHLFDAATGQRI
jgi:multiple sugar transport system ATP-binding protein